MDKNKLTVKTITQYGLLIALAMVLSYLESQIPPFFAIPGMKLGLTNVVVVFALYTMNVKSAAFINIIRIILVGIITGNTVGFAYAIAGGILSLICMYLFKKIKCFSMLSVSVIGGITHNIAQIFVAMILLQTNQIAWYILILWFTGIFAGAAIGIISAELVKRLAPLLS